MPEPFVGRERELALIQAWLADGAAKGRLLTITGEAGIGKTRLLQELLGQGRRGGAVVLSGSCAEGGLGGAFAPFREALDGYVAEVSESTLRAQLGAGAAVLAQLVPRIGVLLTDLSAPVRLQGDQEHARLLDAVSQFLIAIAARAPLVLALDDLHWADEDTLALFRHVGRAVAHHRVLILGAYRDHEVDEEGALARALAILRRQLSSERIALTGLASTEVEGLLRGLAEQRTTAWCAGPVEGALLDAIGAETKGNPFFVRSLVLHLLEEGRLRLEEGRWHTTAPIEALGLPDAVRHVLERRLVRLSEATRSFLSAASATGGTFDFGVAAAAADLGEESALVAVDQALGAQLIEPAKLPDTYAFAHSLVRQALYEALDSSRRARLHRRVAEAMIGLDRHRAVEHAGDIAQQYYLSRSLAGSQPGVTYALVAADRAVAAAAHDYAATLTRMALEMLPPGDERRPAISSRLGLALIWALRFDEALPVLQRSADALAVRLGEAPAADFLAEAAQAMSGAGSPRNAWVLAAQGLRFARGRRDATWVRLMALDISRREAEDPHHPGIPVDNTERREVAAAVAGLSFSPSERLMLAGNGFANPKSRQDALATFSGDVVWLSSYDDEGHGLRQLAECLADSEAQGRIADQVMYLSYIARTHAGLGNLAAAKSAMEKAGALAARLATSSLQVLILAAADYEWRLLLDEGLDELLANQSSMLEPSPENSWAFSSIQSAAARVFARLGMADASLMMLKTLLPCIEQVPGWMPNYQSMLCDSAEALWLLERTDDIEIFERNLREKVVAPDFRYVMRDGNLSLAHLCALQGHHEEAREWFTRARRALDEQGARPLRAIVDHDEAVMYMRRGEATDRECAEPLLASALAQFRAIGMSGWIRRAEALAAEACLTRTGALMPPPQQRGIPATASARILQEGDIWIITFEGRTVRLKTARGLSYLAHLLRHPGREIAAIELVTTCGAPPAGSGREDESIGLDLPSLRQRLVALRGDLQDAERSDESDRAERLRTEIDEITREVARAVGIGDRQRRAGTQAERARVSVQRAITKTLERIAATHPLLDEHLRRTVRTGTFCIYAPDPRAPLEWEE